MVRWSWKSQKGMKSMANEEGVALEDRKDVSLRYRAGRKGGNIKAKW